MGKIEFANALRGVASVSVLFGHFIVMFGALKGQYGGFAPLSSNPYPAWLFDSMTMLPIDLGAFGVAIFFLVSGMVIPNSINSLSKRKSGRLGFVVNRFFRLWPTYFVGLLVTVYALHLGLSLNGEVIQYLPRHIFINSSFFRDWDWTATGPIGGVIWTLEVESKFYLFILVFWKPLSRGNLYPVYIAAILSVVAVNYNGGYPVTWSPPNNFFWFFKYIVFMCIGITFNLHHCKSITSAHLSLSSLILLFTFLSVCVRDGLSSISISYLFAFSVFSILYSFAPAWNGGKIVKFLADISYPLYAVHASFGYIGMRILIENGINSLIALAAMIIMSLLLAWIMHLIVERPTHIAGKYLGKVIADHYFFKFSHGSTYEK